MKWEIILQLRQSFNETGFLFLSWLLYLREFQLFELLSFLLSLITPVNQTLRTWILKYLSKKKIIFLQFSLWLFWIFWNSNRYIFSDETMQIPWGSCPSLAGCSLITFLFHSIIPHSLRLTRLFWQGIYGKARGYIIIINSPLSCHVIYFIYLTLFTVK